MLILLYAFVAAAYLGLAAWAWQGTLASSTSFAIGAGAGAMRSAERLLLLIVWLAHGALIYFVVTQADGLTDAPGDGLRLGFAIMLSATLWLSIAVLWIESLYYDVAGLRLFVLPLTAACALLPIMFPGSSTMPGTASTVTLSVRGNWKLAAHLLVAIAAYGLLTLAAVHASMMSVLARWLHHDSSDAAYLTYAQKGSAVLQVSPAISISSSLWTQTRSAMLAHLPPLLTLERLLFRLVTAGFILLSLTVLTGVVFSEEVFGRPLRFEHKTVFTLLSWLIFAALLLGRHLHGWRGRVALRWTLAGFVALFLAYVGSRFVLQVILHRV